MVLRLGVTVTRQAHNLEIPSSNLGGATNESLNTVPFPLYTFLMSELGGLDIGLPSEGEGGASEGMSEEAKQKFAGASATLQQIQKEEKRAKKRDDGVAQVILQFLTDAQRAHLATLISRLVARDCPSPFILAILSLISPECRRVVQEFLRDADRADEEQAMTEGQLAIFGQLALDDETKRDMIEWLTRIDLVLRQDAETVLRALLLSEGNLDGTILQLTTFVLQEYLHTQKKEAPFEKLQPLSAGLLQFLLAPYIQEHQERLLAEQRALEEAANADE